MKRMLALLSLLCAAGLFSHPTAQAQGLGVSAQMGTLGPGVELTTAFSPAFAARAGVNYLTYSHSDILTDLEVDVEYVATLTLTSFSALLDYYPFQNSFRLSAGAIYNNNQVAATLQPIESYTLEDKTFEPERLGTLSAKVDYGSKLNPYLGLGLGNAARGRFGLSLDLGVLYTSSPRVEMQGTGMIAPSASQAPDIEEGLKSFKFYPVLTLGLNFGV